MAYLVYQEHAINVEDDEDLAMYCAIGEIINQGNDLVWVRAMHPTSGKPDARATIVALVDRATGIRRRIKIFDSYEDARAFLYGEKNRKPRAGASANGSAPAALPDTAPMAADRYDLRRACGWR
jgi:hypothetical protein